MGFLGCNICGFEIEKEKTDFYYCPICDDFTYFSHIKFEGYDALKRIL